MNPDKKIRRLNMLLYTSGAGTILFSLWSGIRGVISSFDAIKALPSMEEVGISDETIKMIIGIMILIIFVGSVLLSFYIGRKAMLTSLGKNKSNRYLVLAIICIIFSARSHIDSFVNYSMSEWFRTQDIILFIIDLTSSIILVEVVVFSILLKIKKKRC